MYYLFAGIATLRCRLTEYGLINLVMSCRSIQLTVNLSNDRLKRIIYLQVLRLHAVDQWPLERQKLFAG
jgi:hypothetical protein